MNVSRNRSRWYNKWAKRQAVTVRDRLGASGVHVVVSPPGPDWPSVKRGGRACPAPSTPDELRRLRADAYSALRAAYPGAALAGAVVPHPERCVESDREGGHEGLHFHVALRHPGRFDGRAVARQHERTGWVVKVLGTRRTLRLVLYELHHAGRWLRRTDGDLYESPGVMDPLSCPKANSAYATEAVTWLGRLPATVPTRTGARVCPVCHESVPEQDWFGVVWSGEPAKEPRGTSGSGPEGPWNRLHPRWNE